jgi:hypothetical protein
MNTSTYSLRRNTVSHRDEVARDDAGGLRSEEAPPALGSSARSRWHSRSNQDLPHGTCCGRHAEPGQLALHPAVAPGGVLAGQTDDQLPDRAVERGTTRTPVLVGPPSSDGIAVPAADGLRPDEQGGPSLPRQEATERRDERSVRRLEPRPGHLSTEHSELMSQHHQLDLVRALTTSARDDQLKQPARRPVDQGHHHANHLDAPEDRRRWADRQGTESSSRHP